MSKKYVIHVNQHMIKKNRKENTELPVLTVKSYNTNDYGHEVDVDCPHCGREVVRVVYRPSSPLACGAHVWIETESKPVVYNYQNTDQKEDLGDAA